MADPYIVPEVTIDPNVGSTKTPRCPKCGKTEPYITHYAMEKRVCIKCDKEEIGQFNASTIVDAKGLPYRPAKPRIINADNISGDGTAKDLTAESQTKKVKKTRKPRADVGEPRVKKVKAGEISISLTVDELVEGLKIEELGKRICDALDLLPATNIADMKKVVAIQDAIKKTFNLEEPK